MQYMLLTLWPVVVEVLEDLITKTLVRTQVMAAAVQRPYLLVTLP
jgi:hypothetical protein